LKQDGFDELVRHLYEVSDPSHDRYGAHLSKEEVDALVAPHQDSSDMADAWLSHNGIEPSGCHRSPSGDWIVVPVTVEQAERMLGTAQLSFHAPFENFLLQELNTMSIVITLRLRKSFALQAILFQALCMDMSVLSAPQR
jgi:tripeptidyl-peptidase I